MSVLTFTIFHAFCPPAGSFQFVSSQLSGSSYIPPSSRPPPPLLCSKASPTLPLHLVPPSWSPRVTSLSYISPPRLFVFVKRMLHAVKPFPYALHQLSGHITACRWTGLLAVGVKAVDISYYLFISVLLPGLNGLAPYSSHWVGLIDRSHSSRRGSCRLQSRSCNERPRSIFFPSLCTQYSIIHLLVPSLNPHRAYEASMEAG